MALLGELRRLPGVGEAIEAKALEYIATGDIAFLAKLREVFLPNSVLVVVPEGEELTKLEGLVPLVGSKIAKGGKATAYVCEKKTCDLPTADPEVFARQLRKKP